MCAALALLLPALQVHAQSVTIPLQYVKSDGWRLGINIGIGAGGVPQLYMFDTGSAVFNAAFNPATWQGFGQTVPTSTVPNGNGLFYCYGSPPCYVGNLVQAPTLNFYAAGETAPAAILSASQGYQINAVYQAIGSDGRVTQSFPEYFQGTSIPPLQRTFYGIFGASNFTSTHSSFTSDSVLVGGVLGQAIIPGVLRQGYVVSANGQPNPGNYDDDGRQRSIVNAPVTGNQIVTIGGSSQPVSPCIACVTVGLTPELIGQIAIASLGQPKDPPPGVVPTVVGTNFPNPNGNGPGNSASQHNSANFTTTLSKDGSTVTSTAPTLLDTGTPVFVLNETMSNGSTRDRTTLLMSGATLSGGTIAGVPTTNATLNGTNDTYSVHFSGTTNILGIPFFMQNSVMFDLTGNSIGYTPFFVTAANLVTTAGGPLIVGSGNVPLGLAGTISGPDGVVIQNGGKVQTSATNTYTGATTIDAGGSLLVSGPGSIQTSSGVSNDGIFDISRAWAPVTISSLTGAATGLVSLGANGLTIANANGTYSGNLSDGGSYPLAGGSLTIAAGTQTLAGASTYTGGTFVKGGTLNLTGTMVGSLGIQSGAAFTTTGGYSVAANALLANAGTFTSLPGAGPLLNQGLFLNSGAFVSGLTNTGTTVNNGTITGNVTNSGALSGSGIINGNLTNAGLVSPGNSIGTLNVVGAFTQAAGSGYQVEANALGLSDAVAVSGAPGTAAIAAGTNVFVAPDPTRPYAPRTTYTILSTTGGVTGTYSSVSSLAAASLPFLLPSLSYDANNVYLSLQIGGFARQALTPNQAAVGAVLDAGALNATGDFATVLGAFSTVNAQQGVAAMNSISGQNYSGFSSAGIATTQVFMTNFANTVGGTSGGSKRVALAEACDVACDTTAPARWGAWGGALGGFGVVGGNANAGMLTFSLGGFAAGIDRRVTDELLVGVTAGFTSGTQWVGGFSGRGISDTFQAGLYASYARDAVYVDGLAAYAYSDNRMQRQITIPGLSRIANGRTGANLFFGQVEAGYRFELGGLAEAYVTPFARLQAATATQNAFTESGAGSLDLSVAAQTTNSLRSVLGAQVGGAMDLGWREKLAMQFKLGWGHEYADTGRPVTASFVGAPALPFTTYGAAPQRDSVVLGLSANTAIADATSVYFRYEGDISSQDSNHALTAGFRTTW